MRPLSLVAALAIAITLSACSSPYTDHQRAGGVEPSVAETQIVAIEGITAADYETAEWYSPGEGGLASASGMDVILSVTVDPQYSIADDAQFLEFLAATAWSVNDHYPKGQVVLAVTGGVDPTHDWLPAAREVFGQDVYISDSILYLDEAELVGEDASTIAINAEEYAAEFGTWPSEPVETPNDLSVNEPPVVPAITDVTATELLNEAGEECVQVEFVRGETFTGAVTVVISDSDGLAVRMKDTTESQLTSCFFAGERPVDGSITVAAQTEPGYSAVETVVTPNSGN